MPTDLFSFLKKSTCVVLGGGAGAWCRFFTGYVVRQFLPVTFPFATLFINVLACFFTGFALSFLKSDTAKTLIITGFLGGFSTFSALGIESWQMLRAGENTNVFYYLALSFVLGIIAAELGYRTALHAN